VNVAHLHQTRNREHGLLARPPCTVRYLEWGWAAQFVDPVAQLEELADLRARGVLSAEEFEHQKARIIGT
jgi:hypothetical protein